MTSWIKRNWAVWLSALLLFAFLALVAVIAGHFLRQYWDVPKTGTATPETARNLEVIKTCIQVLGVVVVGAVITFGAAALETARSARSDLDRASREDFEIRSAMLDRSTRCAQDMFVTCQHVWRQRDERASASANDANGEGAHAREKAYELPSHDEPAAGVAVGGPPHLEDDVGLFELLHRKYLQFSAEAAALEITIGTRYGRNEGPTERTKRPHEGGRPKMQELPADKDHPFWRWHQIWDLLTVYYFSLILTDNQRLRNIRSANTLKRGNFHSGLYLLDKSYDDKEELWWAIREEFATALPAFAKALRNSPLSE